jgi:bacterial leucyl aminopeptidase
MLVLSLLALSALIASTLSLPEPQQAALGNHETVVPERYLIEINPGETQWVTEDDKWALRRVRLLSTLLLAYQGLD